MPIIFVLLAALAGFSAPRGSICSVAATAELVGRGDARRFLAFFECAGWSLAVMTVVTADAGGSQAAVSVAAMR